MDQVPAYSGAVALFVAVGAVLIQLLRTNAQLDRSRREEISDLKTDMKSVKAENVLCNWRLNGLVTVCRQGGLTVPDWIFRDEVPPDATP